MAHNILLLLDGMSAGGLERQIVELLRGMRNSAQFNMLLGVLVKGGEREEEAQRFAHTVLPIRQHLKYDLTLALSLLKFISQYRIDCIHSFGSIADISAAFAGRIKNIPVINGSLRSAPPRLSGRYRLSRLCMPFATWIIANSHAGLRAFGVDKYKNTSVIYNGIALERFARFRCCPSVRNRPEVCMVANFTRKKDQEALIRSFPLVLERFPGAHLTLVGRGTKKIAEIVRLVDVLGIGYAVEIADKSDHPEIYVTRSDVCVLLTNYKKFGEGISNAIMEYMALSKPIIASDCGGNGELIVNGQTGFLIDDHSPEKVSSTILELLGDFTLAKTMGERGKERLEAVFSLDKMIAEYKAFYSKLLTEGSGHP